MTVVIYKNKPTAPTLVPCGSRWRRREWPIGCTRWTPLRGRARSQSTSHVIPGERFPCWNMIGFSLFETVVVTRYVDEGFSGPSLQPSDARQRARMAQICAMLDGYGWLPMVIVVFVRTHRRADAGGHAQ